MGLELLTSLRKQQGITIDALAEKSGVPKGTVVKILSGETQDPKLNTLKALCSVLGCSINDLICDSSEKEKSSPPDEPDDELTNEIAIALYKALIDAGWVKPGEDITEHQRKILLAVISILDTTFNEDGK